MSGQLLGGPITSERDKELRRKKGVMIVIIAITQQVPDALSATQPYLLVSLTSPSSKPSMFWLDPWMFFPLSIDRI